jgi:hypothetical protein
MLAAQADLVPDEKVDVIADHIMGDIAKAEAGELIDLQFFATSRYGSALRALAGIAHRVSADAAVTALAYFTRQPPSRSRHHDDSEAIAVGRIAMTQPSLLAGAISHLVALLACSQTSRERTAERAIDVHIDLAEPHLAKFAAEGNAWARETLAKRSPDQVDRASATAALERLATPLTHEPNSAPIGTNAIGDSLLVRGLTSKEVEPALVELLSRAANPQVGSGERGRYLLAASNLAPTLTKTQRNRHFSSALACATDPIESEHDALEATMSHKLGLMRIVAPDLDSRDRAVYLAACLATTNAQRSETKRQAFALLGIGHDAGYWTTRALQRLGDALNDDVGFLAGQTAPLRSLAAITWASNGGPSYLGSQLAEDADVRVRRAFATALAETDVEEFQAAARARLETDPCYSVRSALRGEYDGL